MKFHKKPVTYVGEVGLKVQDLEEMSRFYTEIIGFDVLERTENEVVLGAGGKRLLVLKTGEGIRPKDRRYTGLYHFAVLLPSRKELGKVLIHLYRNGIRLGSSDHLVSEALYLSDPEGNGIEIYADRDPAVWDWHGEEVRMAVDPIDAEGLVREAQESGETWSGMPVGTVMGHIHLHVSDLDAARRFYVEGLGFGVVSSMDLALFLSDAKYHHHIGMNLWNGEGIPALPEEVAGLGYYTLILENEEKRQETVEKLAKLGAETEEKEGMTEVKDPSGNTIRLLVQ